MSLGTLPGIPRIIPNINIPLNRGQVGPVFNYIASQDSSIIKGASSIGGYAFDYVGEVSVDLHSDITDHYTEDNTVIQDHIALAPKLIMMKGLVGELSIGPQDAGVNGLLTGLQNSLTTINSYIGGKTPQAAVKASKAISQVQKVTTQISSAVSRGFKLIDFLRGGAPISKQQEAYAFFENMWANKILMVVNTPYTVYPNMVIQSLRASQPEDTKFLSSFTVTLKEIRQASIVISSLRVADVVFKQKSPRINGGPGGKDVGSPSTVFNSNFGPKLGK